MFTQTPHKVAFCNMNVTPPPDDNNDANEANEPRERPVFKMIDQHQRPSDHSEDSPYWEDDKSSDESEVTTAEVVHHNNLRAYNKWDRDFHGLSFWNTTKLPRMRPGMHPRDQPCALIRHNVPNSNQPIDFDSVDMKKSIGYSRDLSNPFFLPYHIPSDWEWDDDEDFCLDLERRPAPVAPDPLIQHTNGLDPNLHQLIRSFLTLKPNLQPHIQPCGNFVLRSVTHPQRRYFNVEVVHPYISVRTIKTFLSQHRNCGPVCEQWLHAIINPPLDNRTMMNNNNLADYRIPDQTMTILIIRRLIGS